MKNIFIVLLCVFVSAQADGGESNDVEIISPVDNGCNEWNELMQMLTRCENESSEERVDPIWELEEPHENDEITSPILNPTTTVNVQGQSGKMTITKSNGDKIHVNFDGLYEKDSDGQILVNTGPIDQRHSVSGFQQQPFTIFDPQQVNDLSILADRIDFSTPIDKFGNLSVNTYIIQEDGTAVSPTDQWSVKEGDVKWNIELKDWTFLPGTKYIDVEIEVKQDGFSPSQLPGGGHNNYNIGNGNTLMLSSKLLVDNQLINMPTGYPSMRTVGAKSIFTFRFPRFTTNAIYDPVITSTETTVEDDDTTLVEETTKNTTVEDDDKCIPICENNLISCEEAKRRRLTSGFTISIHMNNNNFQNVGTIFNFVHGVGQNLRGSYNNTSRDDTTNHMTTEAETSVIVNDYTTFEAAINSHCNYEHNQHVKIKLGQGFDLTEPINIPENCTLTC